AAQRHRERPRAAARRPLAQQRQLVERGGALRVRPLRSGGERRHHGTPALRLPARPLGGGRDLRLGGKRRAAARAASKPAEGRRAASRRRAKSQDGVATLHSPPAPAPPRGEPSPPTRTARSSRAGTWTTTSPPRARRRSRRVRGTTWRGGSG